MQNNRSQEIIAFMKVIYDVIDRSYEIEFCMDSKLWLNPNHPVTVERAGLFTKGKDAYDDLQHSKQNVDRFVKMHNKARFPSLKDFPNFIDIIVAGNEGNGRCLQDATNTLEILYNKMVEQFGIGKSFIFDKGKYHKQIYIMPANKFFKPLLPDRTLNRQPIDMLHSFIETLHSNKDDGSLIIESAARKMICILKKVPVTLEQNEKKELFSGTLDSIIRQFPIAIKLLKETINSSNQTVIADELDKIATANNYVLYNKLKNMPSALKALPTFQLSQAIHENDNDNVKSLLAEFDVSKFDGPVGEGNYVPPLHIAAEEGKLDMVKLLIEKGFDCNSIASNKGYRTPLSFAAEFKHQKIIEFLISINADLSITDNFGRTPLEWLQGGAQNSRGFS